MLQWEQLPEGRENMKRHATIRDAWRAWVSPRTPIWVKILPVLALVYALSPLDLIPDILPVLGWIDDILLLWLSFILLARYGRREAAGKTGTRSGIVEGRASVIEPEGTGGRDGGGRS
jgi:uncharacterized membrane protein YkvA (DUF1232 family)